METFKLISDLGGVLFSIFSIFFVGALSIRHFLLKNRPTHLHMAMHFLRLLDGTLHLKMPTLKVMLLTEIYDYITATWLLLRARAWSKRSHFRPILSIPKNGRHKLLGRLFPDRKHFIDPITQYLSEANFEDWRDRAAAAARDPKADPQEEQFVVCLVYDGNSRSLRGIVAPVRVLERFVEEPDSISDVPHEHYRGAPDRPQVLRVVAKAWSDWSKGNHPELAMGLLEL